MSEILMFSSLFIMQRIGVLVFYLLAISEQAIVNTYDLTRQFTYNCPSDVELSCVVLWAIRPNLGLFGNSEHLYRLQCEETPYIDPECKLPEQFEFNTSKLIRPRRTSKLNIDLYRERAEFVSIGCKPTQTSICVSLLGAAYKLGPKYYIIKLRCKDVLEKNCQHTPVEIGEKVTAIFPYVPIEEYSEFKANTEKIKQPEYHNHRHKKLTSTPSDITPMKTIQATEIPPIKNTESSEIAEVLMNNGSTISDELSTTTIRARYEFVQGA